MKVMLVIILIAIALVVYLQQPTRSLESSGATRNVSPAAAIDADGPTTRPKSTIVIAPIEDSSLETRWKKSQSTASPTNPR